MKLNREQVVLALTALVVGAFAWSLASDAGVARRSGSAKEKPLPPGTALDAARTVLGPPEAATTSRNPFAAPRDTRPLPPIPLDPPPLDPLPILSPPGPIAVAPRGFGKFYRVPYAAIPDALPAAEDEGNGEAPATAPSAPPQSSASAPRGAQTEAWKRQYDWYRVGIGYEFGRIRNADRYALRKSGRTAEPLQFEPVNPVTGKPISGTIQVARDAGGQRLEFGFADTIANQVEVRFAELSFAAGNIPELLAFAEWCLERGMEERRAFQRAELVYREVIQLDANDPAGALGLGRLLERGFRLEEAWTHYAAMAEGEFRHRAEPRVRLGALAARLRLHERAEREFQEAIRLEPTSPEAHATYGAFLLERGRPAEAVPEWEAALRLEPPSPPAKTRIRLGLGRAKLAAGDPEGAKKAFAQALESAPGSPDAFAGMAACELAAGNAAGAAETCARALAGTRGTLDLFAIRGIAALRQAIRLAPDEARPLFVSARSDLFASLELDPLRTFVAHASLAFLHEAAARPEEAFQEIEKAFENDPTDPYALYLRARLLRARGDLDAAKDALNAALGRELDFPDALAERGMVALAEERTEDAERYLARAASLAPEEPAFLLLQGIAALARGDATAAEDRFRRAATIDRESAAAANGLGAAAYLRGETDAALKQFSGVVDRLKGRPDSPHYRYAKEAFDRIDDHRTKREWLDELERAELRRGWIEEPEGGIGIRLGDGALKIEGTASGDGEVRVYQERPAPQFVLIEADLTVGESSQAEFSGLFVANETAAGGRVAVNFRVDVVRTRDGAVQTRILKNSRDGLEAKTHPDVTWPAGKTVRLSIERAGSSDDPWLRISLDGEPLVEQALREFRGVSGTYRIGAFVGMSGAGREASLAIDNVRIVYRER